MNNQTYKNPADKVDLSLVPPAAMAEMARAFAFGLIKYKERNSWRNGVKVLPLFAAALRHIFSDLAGQTHDLESGTSHVGHALASLAMIADLRAVKRSPKGRYVDPRFYGPAPLPIEDEPTVPDVVGEL